MSKKKPITLTTGLDISTSVIGVCIVKDDLSSPVHLGWIKLNKGSMWQKADQARQELSEALHNASEQHPGAVYQVAYEEPLTRLSGRSSASVISTLARFNGMVGLIASEVFNFPEPIGFSVHDARKLSGVKVSRKIKTPHKEQVFSQVVEIVGDDWLVYRTKRNGEVVVRDECMDATDAWVVAAACLNSNLPTT